MRKASSPRSTGDALAEPDPTASLKADAIVQFIKTGPVRTKVGSAPPLDLRDIPSYVAEGGGSLLKTWPAARVETTAPRLASSPDAPPARIDLASPAKYVAGLTDVLVRTRSRLIVPPGRTFALHDEYALTPEAEREPKGAGAIFRSGKLLADLAPHRAHVESGIHLLHEYAENYFHWVVEVLPRLQLLSGLGLEGRPLLVASDLHPNQVRLLRIVAGDAWPVTRLPPASWIFVEELVFPSEVCRVPDIYDRAPRPDETVVASAELAEVRAAILKHHGPTPAPRRAIYLRRDVGLRRIVNQDALAAALEAADVEIVPAAPATIDEQIDLFASAKVIVAPTGAALTNILWCGPGTVIVCLMSDHLATNTYLWQQLAGLAGAHLLYVFGPRAPGRPEKYAVHDDYAIDVAEALDALAAARRLADGV